MKITIRRLSRGEEPMNSCDVVEPEEPTVIEEPLSRGELPPPGARVLVVDDHEVDRRLAGHIIGRVDGVEPSYASDGVEALRSIEREVPVAVLTDLQMPGLDGLGLVEVLRDRFPQVPVILMTAYGSEEIAIRALRAGAAYYVPKRELAHDLPEALRRVMAVADSQMRRRRLLGCMQARAAALSLGNEPELHNPLIDLLLEDLEAMGIVDANDRLRVGVALNEAIANAVYHGNLEVSSELRQDDERVFFALADERRVVEPYRTRRVSISSRVGRRAARYIIRDEGPGFNTAQAERPIDPEDLMRIGGRGLLLIRTFMDVVTHNSAGNEITMIKYASPPRA